MEPTAGDSGQMIAAGEPLVFLRPREGEARQEGLACVTYFCGHPGCDCQDALLVAFRLDDRFPELRVERGVAHLELEGALEELQDRGAPRLEAVANLDDGSVEASGPAPLGELQLELLGWLREGMDASVLETLRTRWQLAKGTAGQITARTARLSHRAAVGRGGRGPGHVDRPVRAGTRVPAGGRVGKASCRHPFP